MERNWTWNSYCCRTISKLFTQRKIWLQISRNEIRNEVPYNQGIVASLVLSPSWAVELLGSLLKKSLFRTHIVICVNLQKRLFYHVNLYNYVAHISFIIAINRRLSLTYSVLLISLFFFRVAVHAMLAIVNFSTNNNIHQILFCYARLQDPRRKLCVS